MLKTGGARLREIKPEFMALRLLGVAHNQSVAALVGLGGFFPDHQFHRVAASVAAHAIKLAGVFRPRSARGAAGAGLTRRQRWRVLLGRRVHQDLRRRPPDRPDPEGAQWKACFGGQRRQAVQATPCRCMRDLHHAAALRRHIGPGPVRLAAFFCIHVQRVQHAQANAVTNGAPGICEIYIKSARSPRVLCGRCY